MNILFYLKPKNEIVYLYDDFTLRQVLEKMENCCIFCGARENLRQFFGKNLCSRCVEMLQKN